MVLTGSSSSAEFIPWYWLNLFKICVVTNSSTLWVSILFFSILVLFKMAKSFDEEKNNVMKFFLWWENISTNPKNLMSDYIKNWNGCKIQENKLWHHSKASVLIKLKTNLINLCHEKLTFWRQNVLVKTTWHLNNGRDVLRASFALFSYKAYTSVSNLW